MQRTIGPILAALSLLSLSLCSTTASSQQPPAAPAAARAIGTWIGPLHVGTVNMRLQMTIRADSTRGLAGVLKAIDQGGAEAPATVEVRGDSMSFTIPEQGIKYSGVMDAAGDSIRGTFVQGQSFPLTFARSAAAATIRRPQDPVAPFPYQTKDVVFESAPGIRLSGTIDIPPGKGPFPAVVFVTGSGPQDRDEAGMGHRPFLVIADYLARHGIASLRYDDRGTAQSTGDFASSTTADFAVDAEAAVHFLKAMPQLASRIGILGHSEGGLIAPMVAARSRDVDFIVMLAGPGVADDSLMLLQNRAFAIAAGAPSARVENAMRINRALFDAIRNAKDSSDADRRLGAAKADILASLPEAGRAATAASIDQAIPGLLTPWMRYFVKYDTRDALRRVRVPVLALGGSLDTQVPAHEDLAGIDTALKAAGNHDYRVVELPGLNHQFQPAKTGLPAEYASIDETVAPQVLDLIASWIKQRFGER
ncbi:MAG TPA: alpha/beta fold hydrolase [Gemmatimonadaceae bacterium]